MGVGKEAAQVGLLGNTAGQEFKTRLPGGGGEIFHPTGGTIVDDADTMTFSKQAFDEVRADESRAAGHDDSLG